MRVFQTRWNSFYEPVRKIETLSIEDFSGLEKVEKWNFEGYGRNAERRASNELLSISYTFISLLYLPRKRGMKKIIRTRLERFESRALNSAFQANAIGRFPRTVDVIDELN